MNTHDATEQAYRNGYDAGYKAAKAEIVRCKDCKYSRELNKDEKVGLSKGILICKSQIATNNRWHPVWSNYFCGCGKRKEDANE